MIQNQLHKIITRKDKKLNSISQEISREVREKLQENLRKYWYDAYEPKSYKRTWDLFNSATVEVHRNGMCDYSIEAYFDANKLVAVKNDRSWNAHMGFDSQKFTEGLIASVEHGMKGSLANPRRGDAAHMIEFTRQWAIDYAKEKLHIL